MRFGLHGVNTYLGVNPGRAGAVARVAEQLGMESLWAIDHVVVPSGYESPYPYDDSGKMMGGQEEFDLSDPLIWLSYAAALTERIILATGILILPQRNPLVLAKQVASLDVLSGGRVQLGVGVGWLEEEFTAIGVPFSDRGRRHDDYITAMRALWHDTRASVHTTYATFDDAISLPHPVRGSVPIVIGGGSTRAARRAALIGDGFFPTVPGPEALSPLLDVMRAEADARGRDPHTIEVTVPYTGDPAEFAPNSTGAQVALDGLCRVADAYARIGVTRMLLPVMSEEALSAVAARLAERYGIIDHVIGQASAVQTAHVAR